MRAHPESRIADRRKLTAPLLGIACSLALLHDSTAAQGTAPSINCARAASAVEEMVCRDGALASLDRKLVEVYATASKTATSDQKNRLAADQQRSLNDREACAKSSEKSKRTQERNVHRTAAPH